MADEHRAWRPGWYGFDLDDSEALAWGPEETEEAAHRHPAIDWHGDESRLATFYVSETKPGPQFDSGEWPKVLEALERYAFYGGTDAERIASKAREMAGDAERCRPDLGALGQCYRGTRGCPIVHKARPLAVEQEPG